MKSYTLPSFDNYPILVHEFIPEKPIHKTIVFAPAIAVPQKFYFHCAQYLANKGCHVLTFDYRGIEIETSVPKNLRILKEHGFLSWAKDFEAVSKHSKEKHPKAPCYLIGHSFGGNSIGLSEAHVYYDKFLTVGSQFGYYKYFTLKMRLLIYLNFAHFIPITTRLMGYYPSGWFGLGKSLPTKAAKNWATLLLHPDSMLSFDTKNTKVYYKEIKKPMLLISIEDDLFAPKKSVDILGDLVYKNAPVTRKHILPSDFSLKSIGHFDFFRIKNRDILWPIINDWFQL